MVAQSLAQSLAQLVAQLVAQSLAWPLAQPTAQSIACLLAVLALFSFLSHGGIFFKMPWAPGSTQTKLSTRKGPGK